MGRNLGLSMDPMNGPTTEPVPPLAELDMPAQNLRRYTRQRSPSRTSLRALLARLVTFGGALALTAYATREMVAVVSVGGISILQWAIVVLFALTFAWISITATAAISGVFFGGVRRRSQDGQRIEHRTAIVMPIYNESAAESFAALQAMAECLLDQDAEGFELFVLSDTNNPDNWIRETAAFHSLRESLGDRMCVWYRRRTDNAGRKVGNLHDFITKWGGRYDFMIVLDADSILSAETLLLMVREMAADPNLGLLQTVPRLAGGKTLYARLQQFAGRVYGPIVARGIASWQGDDGNYWGHNAVIRVRAFASSAGLPVLQGRKPFGGAILSHDFVEAALLRRAGWAVRMLPTVDGSWEESPPSVLDAAARDRRWAQGNIQHLAVIGSAGFTLSNRAHMAIGAMSYLASSLWLLLIAVGLATAAQIATVPFEYFTDEMALFPRWPLFDSERMVNLFIVAMVTLLLPKMLGVLWMFADRELWRIVNPLRVVLGAVAETVLSALYAPIIMMMQVRQVSEILWGLDSGWSTQTRRHARTPWATLFRRHWLQTVAGVSISVVLVYVSLPLFLWMSPALAGLVLALPLSAASGSVSLARGFKFLGLLTVPEEIKSPRVIALRDEIEARLEPIVEAATMSQLIEDEAARDRHFASILHRPAATRGHPDVMLMIARVKLHDAHTVAEALAWLTPPERLAVLGDRELFDVLVRLPHPDAPGAPQLRCA